MCDVAESGTLLDSSWRRARKPHRCYACGEAIGAGHQYHIYTSAYDGSVHSSKHCARCWAMCEALWDKGIEVIDFELNCGEIWESPPDAIAELAFALPGELGSAQASTFNTRNRHP